MIDLIIENRFNKLFEEWNQRKGYREGLHASTVLAPSDGNTRFCYREVVFGNFYRPQESWVPVNVLRIFLEGWHVHEKWQKLFVDSGIAECVEKTRNSELWKLMHTPDAIIVLNHQRFVVEIKSMSTNQFVNLNKAPSNAVNQAQLYMYFTGIPDAIILVEDKNSQQFKVFTIEFDLEIVLPYLSRLQRIAEFIEKFSENRLPKRIPQCGGGIGPRFQRCPFSRICFLSRDEREEFKKEKQQ